MRADRALLRLYPPVWRARYEDEMVALIDDTGLSVRGALSLVRGAASAWARPPGHLFDRAARARSSMSVALCAWVASVGGLLIFGQLFQDQLRAPGQPTTTILFRVCAVAGVASVGVLVVGVAPLSWQLFREARSLVARLLVALPIIASGVFLTTLVGVAHAVRSRSDGIGAQWFVGLSGLGLLAGAVGVGGPLVVLHRAAPDGRRLRLAVWATAAATAVLAVAALASVADLVGLSRASHQASVARVPAGVLGAYGVVLVGVACVGGMSAVRGVRAISSAAGERG